MAGTLQTRQLVATALNSIFSERSSYQEKLSGVLQLSHLLNRGLSAVGVCVLEPEDVRGSGDVVFAEVDRRSACRRPFVYAPENAEEAWDSIRPLVRKVGQLARAQRADLERFISSVMTAATSDEGLSERVLAEFPTVQVVDGVHADLNGDLTLVLIAVGIVAKARNSGIDIPLPNITGEPVDGMTPEQIEIFNQLSKTINQWASGGLPWLSDFLVCISIMQFFKARESSLNPSEKTVYLRLQRETFDLINEYGNAFVLWRKMNSESVKVLPEDLQLTLDELEVNLYDAEMAESAGAGVAAGFGARGGLWLVNLMRTAPLPLHVKTAAFVFGASFAASDYASNLADQFSKLANCWKEFSRAYDMRELNPTESRRILSRLALQLTERCRIGSKIACYVRLGLAAGVSVFAYYKWLQFSHNQLKSS